MRQIEPTSIADLAPRIARGAYTSERATEECLAQISARNPRLNAFITITADAALEAARQADREIAGGRSRGALHGIPFSLKDLCDQQGLPTTAASRVREHHRAEADAPVVARLRSAGAVFVGKTNLHEFAFGTTNEDSGWGPARHPRDESRSPGGSSGGSAVSVATGMAIASVGTDTGGSIRIPAAACGLVGLKPEWGEVPADEVVPLSRQLDHVGPLTRSVTDAWLVYEAMCGRLATSETRLERPSLDALRFGVLGGYFFDRMDPEVDTVVRASIERLRRAGARVTETSVPSASDIAPVYLHLVLGDAAAYHAVTLDSHSEAYTVNVRLRLEMGRYVLAEDYARALRGREVLRREVNRALDGVDALLLPALPIAAPPLGQVTVPVRGGNEPVRNAMLRCTQLFNLTGHPALTLPCGNTAAGLPVGLQVVGPLGATPRLLQIARGIEQALDDAR